MRRYLAILLVAAACSRATRQQHDAPAETRSDKLIRARSPIPGQNVVILDGSVAAADLAAEAGELAGKHGGSVLHVYGAALNGFAVTMSARDALALAAEPDVRFVEEDGRVWVAATAGGGAAGTLVAPLQAGTGVNLYVLDTGVGSITWSSPAARARSTPTRTSARSPPTATATALGRGSPRARPTASRPARSSNR